MIKILFLALMCTCLACNNNCPATVELAALRDSLSKSDKSLDEKIKALQGLDAEKDELLNMFDAALGRLDSLVNYNTQLEKKLTERNSEIQKLKNQINSMLKK